MTTKEFRELLKKAPEEALWQLFDCTRKEWENDDDTTRVLALWALRGFQKRGYPRIVFQDNDHIVEYAEDRGLIHHRKD